jgi:hypothetical protein
MSKQFREVLGRDRAQVDLWLNIWFLALFIAVEVVALCWWWNRATMFWLSPAMVVLALFAYAQARDSAEQYGEQVKAAFDVYLPSLAKTLGYNLSCDREVNMRFWDAFSKVMVYHHKESLDNMVSARMTRANNQQIENKETSNSEESDDD